MHNLTFRKTSVALSASEAGQGIRHAQIYDFLVMLMTRGREKAFRQEILDLSGIAPGERLLDIGCGTGTLAIEAAQRAQPGGTVAGVDISPEMLDRASRKALWEGMDISFRRADGADLPFVDESFDIVTVTLALHMMPRDRLPLCLAEMRRVLKPGGRLLLVDYAGPAEKRSHLSARHGRHGEFDLDTLRDSLAELGYGEIEGGPLGWLSLHYLRATYSPHRPR